MVEIVSCLLSTNHCFWNIFTLIFSLIGCIPYIGALVTALCGQIATLGEGAGYFAIHYCFDVQTAYVGEWFEELIDAAVVLIAHLTGGHIISEAAAPGVATWMTEFLEPIKEIFGLGD